MEKDRAQHIFFLLVSKSRHQQQFNKHIPCYNFMCYTEIFNWAAATVILMNFVSSNIEQAHMWSRE